MYASRTIYHYIRGRLCKAPPPYPFSKDEAALTNLLNFKSTQIRTENLKFGTSDFTFKLYTYSLLVPRVRVPPYPLFFL